MGDKNFTDIQRSPDVTTITGYPTVNILGRSSTYSVTFSFSQDTASNTEEDEISKSGLFETDLIGKFGTQTMRTDTRFEKNYIAPTPLTVTINYN